MHPDLQSAWTALYRLRLHVDVEPTPVGVAQGGGERVFITTIACEVGRQNEEADGRRARDITAHTTEATAERI